MASLIPGFEYDIFISYRQKDNKGDRWVSEFVEALKTELASTFKEEINIYFDVNPNDGLLETHDVDASLKEKLKCLVFIPVLSRTYCDPNSFAWENEFKAFIREASGDRFGLNVKLPNGNTTSRILPVRIHDLDPEDIKLLKAQIDLIQPLDFVYYSEGVNRPLRKQDDATQDLKQLIYRDQINKTALAVKGIIIGLKAGKEISFKTSSSEKEQPQERTVDELPAKSARKKLLIGTGILAVLIIAGILVYPGLSGQKNMGRLVSKDGGIPVVIMPFQNMTGDTALDNWNEGIQYTIISNLSNSEDLNVRQLETINGILKDKGLTNYASLTPSVAGLISKNLETTLYIQGNMKQSGRAIRLNANIYETKSGEALQSFQIDGTPDNLLFTIDTLSMRILKFLMISVMKKELPAEARHWKITTSPEALRYYINGLKIYTKPSALTWYEKAVAADSNFFDALNNVWFTYMNRGRIKEARQVCLTIQKKKDMWNHSEQLWSKYQYACTFQTLNEQIETLKRVIEDDEYNTSYHFLMGYYYHILGQYEKAIIEGEKSLELCRKWEMKPIDVYLFALGDSYHKAGDYRKEKKILKIAETYFPDSGNLFFNQAVLALTVGDTITANRYIEKYKLSSRENGATEGDLIDETGLIYSEAGLFDQAEKYYRQALSMEPEVPFRYARLGYFLVDKDRNIDEGVELIDEALKLRPESITYMQYKGWGLYKQGKYQEALELLQKSWDMRIERANYSHSAFLQLESAKKAVAEQR
jgi:tetratricopeptide (TPR) repeat protein